MTWQPMAGKRSLNALPRNSLNLVFPPECLLCRRYWPAAAASGEFCDECRGNLIESRELCPRCAMPLPPSRSSANGSCPACRNERWRFDRVVALGRYQGLLRDLVISAKQASQERLALAAGNLLAQQRREMIADLRVDAVVPVPTHWSKRLLHRGYSAAQVLAEAAAERLGLPLLSRRLVCCRRTHKQGTLPPYARRRNLAGAFRLTATYDIDERRLLLVDDVMTTGATANEAARQLRAGGAAAVFVAVVARATGD